MGRILEYVVFLSHLTLILGVQQYKEASQGSNYEREKLENFTDQFFPIERNDFLRKRLPPPDPRPLRRTLQPPKAEHMHTTLGLRAFATEDSNWRPHGKNFRRKSVHPFSQKLYRRENSKFPLFHGETPSQRYSALEGLNGFTLPSKDFNKRHHNGGRNSRHYPRDSPKICDPCNSVPWVPLLNVPDSYRQQRTHLPDFHPKPEESFNLDYHGFATDNHNMFLPPLPLVPPLDPIYDGTISNSFGLPLGNIPTGHGLLAPIDPLATKATIDYSASFNFLSPPSLLEGSAFPELSPVPVVPIHDSGQFYNLDSAIPDLVPPPAGMDVSKVVLTISEEGSADLQPPKPSLHNHKTESSSKSEGGSHHPPVSGNKQSIDFGKLEIVKSIPLAEFTSSVNAPTSDLPLYPPLQSEYSDSRKENSAHTRVTDNSRSAANVTFTTISPSKSEPVGEHSAPKPLTSPSLSWLFPDHTAPPGDPKAAASVSSFVTETREIASAVNNELRPASPHPLPVTPPNGKSKKIQIIIPYTTKNKNDRDNNALESVRHEVFQPPGSSSTTENECSGDSAHSGATPRPCTESGTDKVIDEAVKTGDEHKTYKYLNEMQHIIASNIRELLREEVEKSQKEQNYPLQNNIDNWTALEYSNHKTLETKAPKEIITQALAVTSIPGTSISHLLLPSKKIPDEYFVTTPLPTYDEPTTTPYRAANSVNSSPFTAKPYATTSIYTPARTFGESTPARTFGESTPASNHGTTYSEVGRERVNNWGKLNENLVVPEARSRRPEQLTTQSGSPFRLPATEKLEIVTPVSLTTEWKQTTTALRRTTREIRTEGPTTETPKFLARYNSTRLERVPSPFSRRFAYNTTTSQFRNSSQSVSGTNSSATAAVDKPQNQNLPKNQTSEAPKLRGSINDIFPFRNKELPWETNLNASQIGYRTNGQRKTLIKQVNLPRPREVVGSS